MEKYKQLCDMWHYKSQNQIFLEIFFSFGLAYLVLKCCILKRVSNKNSAELVHLLDMICVTGFQFTLSLLWQALA